MMPNMQHARKGAGRGLLRNVSSPHEEKYQTWDGHVTVTNFKRGLWSVNPRGRAPFMVNSKRAAFDQAIGIAQNPTIRFTKLPPRSADIRSARGASRAHATKLAKTDKTSDKINVDQLAAMFGLPAWDKIDELNQQHYWEMSRGAGDEEAQMAAESAAQDEVYGKWYDAVVHAASTLFGEHGLELQPTGKQGTKEQRYDFKIVPSTSWDAAANKIRTTLNGVGTFHFDDLKDFLSSGPYTARQAVLSHLGTIRSYPAVYGSQDARRLYEQQW